MLAGTFLFKPTLLGELSTPGPDIPKLTQKAWGSGSARRTSVVVRCHNLCSSGYWEGISVLLGGSFYRIKEGLLGL